MDPLLNKLDDQLVIPLRNDNEKNSWMDILECLVKDRCENNFYKVSKASCCEYKYILIVPDKYRDEIYSNIEFIWCYVYY